MDNYTRDHTYAIGPVDGNHFFVASRCSGGGGLHVERQERGYASP